MKTLASLLLVLAGAGTATAQRPIVAVRGTDPERAGPLAQEAFRAAFGHGRRSALAHEGRTYDFYPIAAVELGGGRIALVSTGELRDAGHAEEGLNAVHYLTREHGRLRVTGRWFGLAAGGSHGISVAQWGVTRALSRWPILYTEGGGTFQGCTVSFATLTELRPAGPVDVAGFPVAFDDGGMVGGPNARQIEGAIASVVPGRSFTVRYRGTMRFSETYVRTGNRYRLAGRRESRMPGC